MGSEGETAEVITVSPKSLGSIPADLKPDFIVYASPPSLAQHGKVWFWKRRHFPEALIGGHWSIPTAPSGRAARLALGTLDFFLVDGEAGAVALAAMHVLAARVLSLADDDAQAVTQLAAFLAARFSARDRSVLWVDEDISLHSPSTKHLVYSLRHLQSEGWEVSAWCMTTDLPAGAMEIRRLPAPPHSLRILTPYWFSAMANGYGLLRWLSTGRRPARIVHTVGGAYLGADLASVQFINYLWFKKQLQLGVSGLKPVLMLLWTALGALKDQLQFSNPRCRMFLPASDSIATDVRRLCRAHAEIRVLANSYDESRFNPEVRRAWREPIRRELGFTPDDTVFVFASQGHHKRKGFWLAVEGLHRVRSRSDLPGVQHAKFLVIGGFPGTLDRLRAELTASYPGWESWVVFVGVQPKVETFLAAANAFLFPSYFEAFCLAEIEAGAMGLPLLLTAHHGTEMILRPGENGLTLPFDPAGIAEVIGRFLREGLPHFEPGAGRGLDRGRYAEELAAIYRDFVESR